MRNDSRSISAEPTADSHTPADVALDIISLRQYLDSRKASRISVSAKSRCTSFASRHRPGPRSPCRPVADFGHNAVRAVLLEA